MRLKSTVDRVILVHSRSDVASGKRRVGSLKRDHFSTEKVRARPEARRPQAGCGIREDRPFEAH
jgi:hypothetical protein